LLRLLLLACIRSRATDLHVEARGELYQVRLRVDGVLVDALRLPNEVGSRLLGVVKVVSDIDPSQRNIIQEGHFSAQVPNDPGTSNGATRRVDYRLSFAPAVYGQKLVVRVLDAATAPARLPDLGLPPEVQKELERAIEQESGMILVCGPTGSGKTSSLYALLRSLNLRERNVVTIEDPVEILIEHATQIPVDEKHNNSFSNVLRSVLRQDPDVILIGEIRDSETARIAMQAAITGHLVFSTVHTKDSVGTIFRLLDLGVEPYLLAQGLQLVLAQRLVRKLCPKCKVPHPITPAERLKLGAAAEGVDAIFEPNGCHSCLGTGYAGQRAFYELLSVNHSLREAISQSPSLKEITQALAAEPFRRLSHAGFELVVSGAVSLDEMEKAVGR
jgi:type II secretory ATPase GspE/PulE/Tfp pilus assembly ATPase PilB-like protein